MLQDNDILPPKTEVILHFIVNRNGETKQAHLVLDEKQTKGQTLSTIGTALQREIYAQLAVLADPEA